MTGEDEIFDLSCEFAVEGREANYNWRSQARDCRRFVIGEQWEEADKEALEKKGVLAITVNHCLPIRDHLAGRQSQTPRDLSVLPAKGGNGIAAMIISAMLKHAVGQSNGLNLKSEMFKDGITTGRGFLGIDIDYSTDPVNGDVVLEIYNPFRVDVDMLDLQYDPNKSARYINVYEWKDRAELKVRYPDADIDDYIAEGLWQKTAAAAKRAVQAAKALMLGDKVSADLDQEEGEMLDAEVYEQLKRRRLPVRKSWVKTWEKVVYWADLGGRKIIRLTKSSDIAKARESVKYMPERFRIYESILPVLHKVCAIGNQKLSYERDPFKYMEGFGHSFTAEGNPLIFDVPALFPVVPYFAYFENGETFGKIDNLIGPQKEENKRRTQFLRLLNSMAAAGWQWKKGSLSEEYKQILKEFGTKPDISIEYTDTAPEKIKPVDTAGTGYLAAAMTSKQDMEDIAGVHRESLGRKTNSGQSGYAIDLKQQADITGNEVVFANLSYSSVLMGNLLSQVLRCGGYYSYEEIESLIDEEDLIAGPILAEAQRRAGPPPSMPPPPNQAAMQLMATRFGDKGQMAATAVGIEYEKRLAQFQQQQEQYNNSIKTEGKNVIMESVRDIKVGRYGTKVVESPTSPTLRAQTFEQLVALDKMRPGQLPFDEIIKASDIPNKEKMIEKMKAQAPMLPAGG